MELIQVTTHALLHQQADFSEKLDRYHNLQRGGEASAGTLLILHGPEPNV